MLILTRTPGEKVQITTPQGEKIILTMVRIKGKEARLGITASPDYNIDRLNPQGVVEPRHVAQRDEREKQKKLNENIIKDSKS